MKNIFKNNPILPANIKLVRKNNHLFVNGPKGSICLNISFLNQSNLNYSVKKIRYSSFLRLFKKALTDVRVNFVVSLTFVGVGFRIESVENNFINLKLGFSHLVRIRIPERIQVFTTKKTSLILQCIDEQLLKEFSSKIYSYKKPDIYKGKGILYKNQLITFKEGKKK
jgi:large subunit ribosomal protein L6|mmetsp:Transcript_9052/g.15359  ORF Transcript_9052/g.15359 Transcript_9052/m.15359 type:complete len:168 (+) Transcript_9052:341-844(+)